MFKRIEKWRKDPLVIPRSLLSAEYIGFAVLGLLVLLGGLPTLDLLTFTGYTPLWSILLIGSSMWGGYFSLSEAGETRERSGALLVWALLSTWAVAAVVRTVFIEADIDRLSGAWAVFLISMLPGSRAFGLLKGAKK